MYHSNIRANGIRAAKGASRAFRRSNFHKLLNK